MKELWDVLRPEEQIELQIRRLYQEHHFHLYQLNSFEEFEGYQQQRNFLKIVRLLPLPEMMVERWL